MDEVPEEALTDRDLFRVDEVDFKGSIQVPMFGGSNNHWVVATQTSLNNFFTLKIGEDSQILISELFIWVGSTPNELFSWRSL